jgi:hypothetical protein
LLYGAGPAYSGRVDQFLNRRSGDQKELAFRLLDFDD